MAAGEATAVTLKPKVRAEKAIETGPTPCRPNSLGYVDSLPPFSGVARHGALWLGRTVGVGTAPRVSGAVQGHSSSDGNEPSYLALRSGSFIPRLLL